MNPFAFLRYADGMRLDPKLTGVVFTDCPAKKSITYYFSARLLSARKVAGAFVKLAVLRPH